MITETIQTALNKQIELEAYASNLYLSMASWCDTQSLAGCAEFMHRQSIEEREHMMRLFHYISDVDGHAITPGINQPPIEFENVKKMFEQVYEHEKKVTNEIHRIVDLCYKENDYSTLNFLQWYIQEQREEEALMRTILDKIKIIGSGPQSIYFIDREIENFNNKVTAAEPSGE